MTSKHIIFYISIVETSLSLSFTTPLHISNYISDHSELVFSTINSPPQLLQGTYDLKLSNQICLVLSPLIHADH